MPPLDARAWPKQPGGDPARAPDRRTVLKLLGASFALGGVAGCDGSSPDGQYFPAVVAPPGIVSGIPNNFATAATADGTAIGIVVEHAMGRPIKIEGNPNHPSSLGATDAVTQALILDFYDPDRAGGIQHAGRPSDRQSLLTALLTQRAAMGETQGRGLRILTGPVCSPSIANAVERLRAKYPALAWHIWDPSARDSVRDGAARAYGRAVDILPRLDRADLVLALDSDLLSTAPGHVRHARDFARRRNPDQGDMSRVYAIEATPTLIGAAADHRLRAGPREMWAVLTGLSGALLRNETPGDGPNWLPALIGDLRAAQGRAFVHGGPALPAEAHALLLTINEALGGRGRTFDVIAPPQPAASPMTDLIHDMQAGMVDQLVILDCNPAFTCPGFADALRHVGWSLSANVSLDETAFATQWFVPLAHPFESWGDAAAHDGTATILQPQALPLYGGWNALAILSLLAEGTPVAAVKAVRDLWRDRLPTDEAWRAALASGVVPGTAHAALDVALRPDAARTPLAEPEAGPVTIRFEADPYLGDGRWANNAWLQELPRPHTKLVWDNPLLVSPELARDLGADNGDRVKAEAGGVSVELPVWIVPGQAADVAVATLGNGRRIVGAAGAGQGIDLYPLRAASVSSAPQLTRAEGRDELASTDRHYRLEADTSDILRHRTLAALRAGDGARAPDNPDDAELLYRRKPDAEVQWGMSVDLNACIGCNACVVACQAENNVPVVGKDEVLRHREMHWLRIDRYDIGADTGDHPAFQPVLCMHCEQAPCEYVCPVAATQHDSEGLNLMVYNRCVGTRFCSNNCPYKVRRFNYAAFAHREARPPIARNPDVSVRTRGVMEKCTFCVQRIVEARITHDRDGAKEVATTACQAACPTRVFAFGDLSDPDSEVVRRKASQRDYPLLPETSSFPRVTYASRITNENAGIKS